MDNNIEKEAMEAFDAFAERVGPDSDAWEDMGRDQIWLEAVRWMQAREPEPQQPPVSVPDGWTIETFDVGVSILWPGKRGGVHIKTDDPNNDIADNVLHDLALAMTKNDGLTDL